MHNNNIKKNGSRCDSIFEQIKRIAAFEVRHGSLVVTFTVHDGQIRMAEETARTRKIIGVE